MQSATLSPKKTGTIILKTHLQIMRRSLVSLTTRITLLTQLVARSATAFSIRPPLTFQRLLPSTVDSIVVGPITRPFGTGTTLGSGGAAPQSFYFCFFLELLLEDLVLWRVCLIVW